MLALDIQNRLIRGVKMSELVSRIRLAVCQSRRFPVEAISVNLFCVESWKPQVEAWCLKYHRSGGMEAGSAERVERTSVVATLASNLGGN